MSCKINIGILCNKSFCIISDDTEHDVAMVYYIQNICTDHLKLILPHIKKIEYFSDGCAGQYKNRKNLYTCVSIDMILELKQCGIYLRLLMEKHVRPLHFALVEYDP